MKTQFYLLCFLCFTSLFYPLNALGSGSTLTISYGNATVCGIVAAETNRHIQCYNGNSSMLVQPNISYDVISGGQNFFCGLRSGGQSLICWDTFTFLPKRIYYNTSYPLWEISVGNDQVCGIVNRTNQVYCWRGMKGFDQISIRVGGFLSISSGIDFSCGILVSNHDNLIISSNSFSGNYYINDNNVNISGRVKCWGKNSSLANEIENQFGGFEMVSITAGGKHVCGFDSIGDLICKGENFSGQLGFPFDVKESAKYSKLALGWDYSCAIRVSNGSVVCWGGGGKYSSNLIENVQFETLVGGFDFVCGLITRNFSSICWGPGWLGNASFGGDKILPGICVESECSQCGIVPGSQSLCSGSGNICNSCGAFSPSPLLPVPSPSRTSRKLRKGLLAFAIVGSIGVFAGICTVVYCLYAGLCFGRKKIHNSVQPRITRGGSSTGRVNSSNSPPSRSMTVRRQGSRAFRRQRSGTSSMKHVDRAEEFSFQELAAATNEFSLENKIGSGSFGMVYKGKLADGREVAIKRGEISQKPKKYQEKESAFDSELAFLSRVHHKHLVRLVGYCEERDERLLVYDYMKNGSLRDHLHDKKNVEKESSVINSWKMRIRIALDAARGIEYLHNYAVPPIIHRDINSSNILLDGDWTARVSDFGLSLMGPDETERDFRPTKVAGTVGYIDPEYYGMNVLTAKSDVYGFGVVLLELLTGKKAIFKDENDGGTPVSVVDYAVPAILAGELLKILDPRVGHPASNESEAVELVAYTALHCVNLEGKDRPTMADIVGNLERGINLCDDSHGSISSAGMSIGSD